MKIQKQYMSYYIVIYFSLIRQSYFILIFYIETYFINKKLITIFDKIYFKNTIQYSRALMYIFFRKFNNQE